MTESEFTQDQGNRNPGLGAVLFAFLLVAALMYLAIYQLRPPPVVPADAPAREFSAARALEQLKIIAQKPRPNGSAENARVREYLLGQLRSLGFDPQVQTATVARYDPKWKVNASSAATVNNVVARLPGSEHSRALMLAAHYDSVPAGPGASDDGSGTVTLIETARALKADPPLRNDVIFLFTDGEERGLLGAQAFADEHPWAKDVALVLDFEARGACGSTSMFETSARNGWLIREFAHAAPRPLASSMAYEVYKRLPNDTDLTVFKRAGMAGLNFAYIGCWTRYHTLRDDVADLDPRSLQHDGSYAVALARHFGNLSLASTAAPDAVFFTVFNFVLYYPVALTLPLMFLSLVVFGAAVVLGFRARRLSPGGIVRGVLGWLTGAAVATGVSTLLWILLRRTRLVSRLPYGMAYNEDLYVLGFVALTVAVMAVFYVRLSRKSILENLTVGALAWWALLSLLCGLYAPGASYLFIWPLLAAALELCYIFFVPKEESAVSQILAWAVPAIVVTLIFGPLPYLIHQSLGAFGLPGTTVAAALLLGFLFPLLHIMTASRPRWLPAGAGALALAFLVAAMLRSGYDAVNPRGDSIFYGLNADTGKAVWASLDPAPDPWTSQFLAGLTRKADIGEFTYGHAPLLEADAPAASLAAPQVTALEDLTLGQERVVRLLLTSPRGATRLWVRLQNASVLEADLNGKKLPPLGHAADAEGWGVFYANLPPPGLVLTLKVLASAQPTLTLVDQSEGLPEFPGASFRPRPPDLMPSPMLSFDSCTLVSKTYRLDASLPMHHH